MVDKTGTLTEGKPRLVVGRARRTASSEAERAGLAASLERGSEHPLAAAIVAGRRRSAGVAPPSVTDFQSLTGRGVTGTVDGPARRARQLRACSRSWASTPATLAARAEALRAEGQTVMFLVAGDAVAGLLGVADPIKATHAGGDPQLCTRRACASSC